MLDLLMQSCSWYPLQIISMKCRYCYSAKIDTRVFFFQSIARLQDIVVHNLFKKTSDFTLKMESVCMQVDRLRNNTIVLLCVCVY